MNTIEQRFWSKVALIPEHTCWEWVGTKCRGYGHLSVKGKDLKAHRVAWELHNGPIPEGLVICHHCDNPGCVNPAHLFLGTLSDNTQDCSRKKRLFNMHRDKTHCKYGHSLADAYQFERGRVCRQCARRKNRISQQRRTARHREQRKIRAP